MSAPTSVPIVTVLVETLAFGPAGAPHDVLTELVEVIHRLGSGRCRGQLVERRYDLFEDGTRLLTGVEVIRGFAAQGADAAVILQRSAIGGITSNPAHTTEEIP